MNRRPGPQYAAPVFTIPGKKSRPRLSGAAMFLRSDADRAFADIFVTLACCLVGEVHMDRPADRQRSARRAALSETLDESITRGGVHEPGDVRIWLAAIAQQLTRNGN